MHFRSLLLSVYLLAAGNTYAQVDGNTAAYRNTGSNKYFRVHYDNDFFTNSDYYYSQGISLELAHPGIGKFLLAKLLIQPTGNDMVYGLALNDFGYTPTSISSNEILYGDRPFSAVLYLKTFAIATDTSRNRRISSSLSTGIIGPAAGGKQMQTGIHRWLKNIIPLGWQHQVQNDVVLNYQVNYDQQVWAFRNLILLNAGAELQAGTLKDKLSAGFNLMLGKLNSPYKGTRQARTFKKHFNCHLYVAPQISLVGYDASLQGGIFNKTSPYTIAAKDISRVTFQANAGIVLNIGKLHLEYCQSYLSKEFRTGNFHRWAGLKIGLLF
ncbi:MAG: lipid A deacylase LpxR family protein [Bacteroidota bacterium]